MSMLQITALARRVACADAQDKREMEEILSRLQDVRNALKRASDHETQTYLDAAILLQSYVVNLGHIGGTEVVSVVGRLLTALQKVYAERAAAGNYKELPTPAESGSQQGDENGEKEGLRLVGEHPDGTWGPGAMMRLIGDLFLGECMIHLGMVRPEQVEHALAVQKATGIRFGEALVQSGAATWEQIKEGLRYQEENRNKPAPLDSSGFEASAVPKNIGVASGKPKTGGEELRVLEEVLLGQILIQNGIITEEQLQAGLKHQQATGMRIGEALIAIGAAVMPDVEYGLRLQSQMRRYA